MLRRYATVAVLVVCGYLLVQLLRQPLPALTSGSWSGFWVATDTVVGVSISWVPLAADYARHSRSPKAAAAGIMAGYSITQVLCYTLGLLALLTVARHSGDIYGAFIALPAGSLAFAVLAVRELDQCFADVYSTAVSVQNFRPRWDRRFLAIVDHGLLHGRRPVAEHRRLRELPDPHRLGLRAAVGGADHGLLRHRARGLGPVAAVGHPLADARAVGARASSATS